MFKIIVASYLTLSETAGGALLSPRNVKTVSDRTNAITCGVRVGIVVWVSVQKRLQKYLLTYSTYKNLVRDKQRGLRASFFNEEQLRYLPSGM